MIEKTIHYVWLGSAKMPEEQSAFIRGWRELHPDWQFVCWDETNFDRKSNSWVSTAMEQKNYPLAADIIRSYALLHNGGVYLDTDVELFKPLDELVTEADFFIGYETDFWFGCAVLGAKKGHPVIREAYERYLTPCEGIDAASNMLCVLNFSAVIQRLYNIKLDGKSRKIADNVHVYARDWFFPQDYITRRINITENTVAMHHYSSAWWSVWRQIGLKTAQGARLILGRGVFGCFERFARFRMLKKLEKEYTKRKVEHKERI